MSLPDIAQQVRVCTRCRLAENRTHAVPGEGAADAALMLVGEAPGAKEDESGRPFQGMAGRFLDRQLEALGLRRDDLFITSVNKCRPPGNRTPRPDEVQACRPYLSGQFATIAPRVVLAMGGTAARELHPDPPRQPRIADLRGEPIGLADDRFLCVTYHPAAAMRFPAQREPFAADLSAAARLAGLQPANER